MLCDSRLPRSPACRALANYLDYTKPTHTHGAMGFPLPAHELTIKVKPSTVRPGENVAGTGGKVRPCHRSSKKIGGFEQHAWLGRRVEHTGSCAGLGRPHHTPEGVSSTSCGVVLCTLYALAAGWGVTGV